MGDYVYKSLGNGQSIYYRWFMAMHTRVDLVLCHRGEDESHRLSQLVEDEIRGMEQMVNRFDPGSEISRVNLHSFGSPYPASEELLALIHEALEWREKTGGYFDITVQSHNHSPQTADKVWVSLPEGTIQFQEEGIVLDLNGYAKGYALDKCLEILRAGGATDVLLNLGNSSVGALGNHPNGEGWPVELAEGSGEIPVLKNRILTTSGMAGDGASHIIDPCKNTWAESSPCISVITNSGAAGEALSTALYAAPESFRSQLALLPEVLGVFVDGRKYS